MKLKELNNLIKETLLNEIGIGIGSSSKIASRMTPSGSSSSSDGSSSGPDTTTVDFLKQIAGDHKKIIAAAIERIEKELSSKMQPADIANYGEVISRQAEVHLDVAAKSLKLGFIKSMFKKSNVKESDVINQIVLSVVKDIAAYVDRGFS
jgi:hypothetical protein